MNHLGLPDHAPQHVHRVATIMRSPRRSAEKNWLDVASAVDRGWPLLVLHRTRRRPALTGRGTGILINLFRTHNENPARAQAVAVRIMKSSCGRHRMHSNPRPHARCNGSSRLCIGQRREPLAVP